MKITVKNQIINIIQIFIIIAIFCSTVEASPITYAFQGEVDIAIAGRLTGEFNPFDQMDLVYTFESTSVPDPPAEGPIGTNVYTNAITNLSLTIGGDYTATALRGDIEIFNDVFDVYRVKANASSHGLSGPMVGLLSPVSFLLQFIDHDPPDALSDTSLTQAFDPDDFGTLLGVSLTFSEDGVSVIGSILTAQTPAPIPEPATILLLGTGLIGLARLRRKIKE